MKKIYTILSIKNIILALICSLLINCAGNAKIENSLLTTPEQLQQWCKNKTTQYFKEKNKSIQSWSAVWKLQDKLIDVKASLMSQNTGYIARCRVQQGENSEKAIILISAVPGNNF